MPRLASSGERGWSDRFAAAGVSVDVGRRVGNPLDNRNLFVSHSHLRIESHDPSVVFTPPS